MKQQTDIVTQAQISYMEKFLDSQGIVTSPSQLPPAGSNTISQEQSVIGALDIVRHLSDSKHFYQMPFWQYRETPATNIYLVGTWYKCLLTLLSLVSRPWWERIWMVQEVVLSSDAILNIGRHQVFLSSFFRAAKNYAVHSEGCCKTWIWLWHGRSDDIFLPLITKMALVKDLGGVIDDHAANILVPVKLALLSQKRKATDPRDHLYAITGLMKNPFTRAPLGPVPDYRLNPAHLYREQTLALMQQSSSIDLLERAIGVDAPNPLGLPSWVCDWSRSKALGWRSALYNACNGHEHQFHPAAEGVFVIAGAMVGIVSKLGESLDCDMIEDIAVKVENWQQLAGEYQPFDINTVLRTTLLDMIMPREGQHRRLNPNDITLLKEWWWQWIIRMKRRPDPIESPDTWTIHHCFSYQMDRDRVFATREGHLGVGPRTLRVGDRIFIVEGVAVPLIFRTLQGSFAEASSPHLSRDYAYVGRCYLHGCMDGEAVNPDTKWQTLNLH